MLKSAITGIVRRYANTYLEDIDADLNVWGGDFRLDNIKLRLDVLQGLLGLPPQLILSQGTAASLRIRIPWTSLSSSPVQVTLTHLRLHIAHDASVASAPAPARPKPTTVAKEDIKPPSEGWGETLLSTIISNVEVEIEDIEVTVSSSETPLVLAFSMAKLAVASVDEHGNKAFRAPQGTWKQICKEIELKECQLQVWTNHRRNAERIVYPFGIQIRAVTHLKTRIRGEHYSVDDLHASKGPKTAVDITFSQEIHIAVSDTLLQTIGKIVSASSPTPQQTSSVTSRGRVLDIGQPAPSPPLSRLESPASRSKGWGAWMPSLLQSSVELEDGLQSPKSKQTLQGPQEDLVVTLRLPSVSLYLSNRCPISYGNVCVEPAVQLGCLVLSDTTVYAELNCKYVALGVGSAVIYDQTYGDTNLPMFVIGNCKETDRHLRLMAESTQDRTSKATLAWKAFLDQTRYAAASQYGGTADKASPFAAVPMTLTYAPGLCLVHRGGSTHLFVNQALMLVNALSAPSASPSFSRFILELVSLVRQARVNSTKEEVDDNIDDKPQEPLKEPTEQSLHVTLVDTFLEYRLADWKTWKRDELYVGFYDSLVVRVSQLQCKLGFFNLLQVEIKCSGFECLHSTSFIDMEQGTWYLPLQGVIPSSAMVDDHVSQTMLAFTDLSISISISSNIEQYIASLTDCVYSKFPAALDDCTVVLKLGAVEAWITPQQLHFLFIVHASALSTLITLSLCDEHAYNRAVQRRPQSAQFRYPRSYLGDKCLELLVYGIRVSCYASLTQEAFCLQCDVLIQSVSLQSNAGSQQVIGCPFSNSEQDCLAVSLYLENGQQQTVSLSLVASDGIISIQPYLVQIASAFRTNSHEEDQSRQKTPSRPLPKYTISVDVQVQPWYIQLVADEQDTVRGLCITLPSIWCTLAFDSRSPSSWKAGVVAEGLCITSTSSVLQTSTNPFPTTILYPTTIDTAIEFGDRPFASGSVSHLRLCMDSESLATCHYLASVFTDGIQRQEPSLTEIVFEIEGITLDEGSSILTWPENTSPFSLVRTLAVHNVSIAVANRMILEPLTLDVGLQLDPNAIAVQCKMPTISLRDHGLIAAWTCTTSEEHVLILEGLSLYGDTQRAVYCAVLGSVSYAIMENKVSVPILNTGEAPLMNVSYNHGQTDLKFGTLHISLPYRLLQFVITRTLSPASAAPATLTASSNPTHREEERGTQQRETQTHRVSIRGFLDGIHLSVELQPQHVYRASLETAFILVSPACASLSVTRIAVDSSLPCYSLQIALLSDINMTQDATDDAIDVNCHAVSITCDPHTIHDIQETLYPILQSRNASTADTKLQTRSMFSSPLLVPVSAAWDTNSRTLKSQEYHILEGLVVETETQNDGVDVTVYTRVGSSNVAVLSIKNGETMIHRRVRAAVWTVEMAQVSRAKVKGVALLVQKKGVRRIPIRATLGSMTVHAVSGARLVSPSGEYIPEPLLQVSLALESLQVVHYDGYTLDSCTLSCSVGPILLHDYNTQMDVCILDQTQVTLSLLHRASLVHSSESLQFEASLDTESITDSHFFGLLFHVNPILLNVAPQTIAQVNYALSSFLNYSTSKPAACSILIDNKSGLDIEIDFGSRRWAISNDQNLPLFSSSPLTEQVRFRVFQSEQWSSTYIVSNLMEKPCFFSIQWNASSPASPRLCSSLLYLAASYKMHSGRPTSIAITLESPIRCTSAHPTDAITLGISHVVDGCPLSTIPWVAHAGSSTSVPFYLLETEELATKAITCQEHILFHLEEAYENPKVLFEHNESTYMCTMSVIDSVHAVSQIDLSVCPFVSITNATLQYVQASVEGHAFSLGPEERITESRFVYDSANQVSFSIEYGSLFLSGSSRLERLQNVGDHSMPLLDAHGVHRCSLPLLVTTHSDKAFIDITIESALQVENRMLDAVTMQTGDIALVLKPTSQISVYVPAGQQHLDVCTFTFEGGVDVAHRLQKGKERRLDTAVISFDGSILTLRPRWAIVNRTDVSLLINGAIVDAGATAESATAETTIALFDSFWECHLDSLPMYYCVPSGTGYRCFVCKPVQNTYLAVIHEELQPPYLFYNASTKPLHLEIDRVTTLLSPSSYAIPDPSRFTDPAYSKLLFNQDPPFTSIRVSSNGIEWSPSAKVWFLYRTRSRFLPLDKERKIHLKTTTHRGTTLVLLEDAPTAATSSLPPKLTAYVGGEIESVTLGLFQDTNNAICSTSMTHCTLLAASTTAYTPFGTRDTTSIQVAVQTVTSQDVQSGALILDQTGPTAALALMSLVSYSGAVVPHMETCSVDEIQVMLCPLAVQISEDLFQKTSQFSKVALQATNAMDRESEAPPTDDANVDQACVPRLYVGQLLLRSWRVDVTLETNLAVYIGIRNMPIRLHKIHMYNMYTLPQETAKEVLGCYLADVLILAPLLVGSLELIGNPTALLQGIGKGLQDLIGLPQRALSSGPSAFVLALGGGVSSLMQNVTQGTLMSISGFSASLARNMQSLSSDDFYTLQRQVNRLAVPQGFFHGVQGGITAFSHGVLGGIVGIVSSPWEGAKIEGVWGLVKGMGHAASGVITKPVGGTLDLVTHLSRGLAASTAPRIDVRSRPSDFSLKMQRRVTAVLLQVHGIDPQIKRQTEYDDDTGKGFVVEGKDGTYHVTLDGVLLP